MSISLDSTHVFSARLATIKLDEYVVEKFAELAWFTYGDYAFATGFSPGAPVSDEMFRKEILVPVLGEQEADNPANANRHRLRRLYWEAYSAAAADLARRISPEAPEDKNVKTLPPEERAARLASLIGFPCAKQRMECNSQNGSADLDGDMILTKCLPSTSGPFGR